MWEKKKGARIFGYARVSTEDQDFALQIHALEREGVDHIFKEKVSGKSMDRPIFNILVDCYLRPGDRVVVWKLDRLGRSMRGLCDTVEMFDKKGYDLKVLTEGFDTSTPAGRMFFHFMAAMAQFESDLISQRTKAGIAAKKERGERMGRPFMIQGNKKRMKLVRRLDGQGKLRDENGEAIITDRELWIELDKVDPDNPIKNIATVRRWRTAGYPGLDEGDQG